MSYTKDLILERRISMIRNSRKQIVATLKSLQRGAPTVDIPVIIADVAREFGIPPKILFGSNRGNWIMQARKFCVWLLWIHGHRMSHAAKATKFNHTSFLHHAQTFPDSFLLMSEDNQDSAVKLIQKYATT